MSLSYNYNKKRKRTARGVTKTSGFWELVKRRFKDAKGRFIMKKKTGKNKESFVPKRYGV